MYNVDGTYAWTIVETVWALASFCELSGHLTLLFVSITDNWFIIYFIVNTQPYLLLKCYKKLGDVENLCVKYT
jgi:hypothetical protein